MTTLAEYTAAVEAKGYESVTTEGAIPAAINAARRRIVNARRWTFLEATDSTLATAYGGSSVAVNPAWRIDAVRMRDTTSWNLTWRTPQEVQRLLAEDSTPGTPAYWSKRAGAITFYPAADGVYTLAVDYVIETVPTLVAAEDVETVLEPTMIDVVAWAAARELAYRMRDFNAVSFADAEYQTLFAAAVRDDNTAQRQASRQVVSNPDRYGGR